MNLDRLQELAALHSVGALDGNDLDEWQSLELADDPRAKAELAAFNDAAALLGVTLATRQRLPPALKEKILQELRRRNEQRGFLDQLRSLCPTVLGGFSFARGDDETGWQQLPVPGASIKPLFVDASRGYALVMGKLDPGSRYPSHRHLLGEEVYILSGDLHIGDRALKAGDFHHADAGTTHGVNFSEQGCVILAVISTQDLQT